MLIKWSDRRKSLATNAAKFLTCFWPFCRQRKVKRPYKRWPDLCESFISFPKYIVASRNHKNLYKTF